MLALFSIQEKKGFVDLYFNDLVGVKTVISDLKMEFSEERQEKREIKKAYFDKKLFRMKDIDEESLESEDEIKTPAYRQAVYLLIAFHFEVFYS